MTDHGPYPPSDPGAPLERRLATILCADVAGYSRMMGENEERTVQVFRGHREVFESLVAMHRGRIFNTAGDALLAEFNSAVEAVRCATEIQAALRTRNEALDPDARVHFRIGINLGDVIVQGEDLLGDGVNVAARIQAATQPGGVCISGSVYDQIQNKLSLAFTLLGEQTYKNIARPVRTYAIGQGTMSAAPSRRAWPKAAAAVVAALALAGAAVWGYRQYEAGVAAHARLEADLASQLALQKQATERALAAADATKRAADARTAEDDRRRAQDERTRSTAPATPPVLPAPAAPGKSTAPATPAVPAITGAAASPGATASIRSPGSPATPSTATSAPSVKSGGSGAPLPPSAASLPAVAAAPPGPGGGAQALDGVFNGTLCNYGQEKAPLNCWRVVLIVRGGTAEGSWISFTKHTSKAAGTVAADGALELKIAGWTRKDEPTVAVLTGRVTRDAITASGAWRNGSAIVGDWKRAATAAAPAASPRLASLDGIYPGRICNHFKDASTPPRCWSVALMVRNGHVDAKWPNGPERTSTASGTVTADGALELKIAGWTRQGEATEGVLVGRVIDGAITASGQWRGGNAMAADWKRAQ